MKEIVVYFSYFYLYVGSALQAKSQLTIPDIDQLPQLTSFFDFYNIW